jgi:hypothetical protein
MKKSFKLVALLVIISLFSVFMAGCNMDEMKVFSSMVKAKDIKSMESKTNLTFRFEAEGFSEEQNEIMQTIAPILNNLKLSMSQKINQNEDKSIIKSQLDTYFEVGGVSSSLGVWTDSDTTGDKPYIKEIVRVPAIVTAAFPSQFKGKQYIQLDMANIPGTGMEFTSEYKQMLDFNKDFASKFIEFLKEYSTQFDPGFKFITYKDGHAVNGEFLTFYEIKLDDKSFKAFIKYAASNLIQNKKSIELLKELLSSVIKLSEASNQLTGKSGISPEEMLDLMQLNIPGNVETINKVFEAFKDVKIVGDKGIIINYGINNEGYIVSESGTLDFTVDLKAMEEAVQKLMEVPVLDFMDEVSGIINFGFDFDTQITNINKDVKVTFPELTKKNSFTYDELYEVLNPIISDNFGFAPSNYNNEPVNIVIDNKDLGSKVRAKVENGIIMVPVRAVSEALGAKVVANSKSQTVTVQKGDTKIVFKTKSTEVLVNGRKISMYSPMILVDKKNYVPVSVLADNLDVKIQWNRKTNSLLISSDYYEND